MCVLCASNEGRRLLKFWALVRKDCSGAGGLGLACAGAIPPLLSPRIAAGRKDWGLPVKWEEVILQGAGDPSRRAYPLPCPLTGPFDTCPSTEAPLMDDGSQEGPRKLCAPAQASPPAPPPSHQGRKIYRGGAAINEGSGLFRSWMLAAIFVVT